METQISSDNASPAAVCLFNWKMSEEATKGLELLQVKAKSKNLDYVFVCCGNNFSGSVVYPNITSIDSRSNGVSEYISKSDDEFDLSGIACENDVFY